MTDTYLYELYTAVQHYSRTDHSFAHTAHIAAEWHQLRQTSAIGEISSMPVTVPREDSDHHSGSVTVRLGDPGYSEI